MRMLRDDCQACSVSLWLTVLRAEGPSHTSLGRSPRCRNATNPRAEGPAYEGWSTNIGAGSGFPSPRLSKLESRLLRLRAHILLAAVALSCVAASAQTESACTASGYRVLARRWDAVLGVGWELRQNCAHPQWPARSVAIGAADSKQSSEVALVVPPRSVERELTQPLLVRAGEPVRLWMQDATVRIEMSGVAEQSARGGERIVVRITHPSDDQGLTVERIGGIVRGAGDVEMER